MSGKSDKRTRRLATKQAIKTVDEYVRIHAIEIMDRSIQAMKSLPIEERQKIADAIIKGNDVQTP